MRTIQQTPGGVQQARRRRRSRRPAAKPKAYRDSRSTRNVFRAGRPDRTCTTQAMHYSREGRPGPTLLSLLSKTRPGSCTTHQLPYWQSRPRPGGGPPCFSTRTMLGIPIGSVIGNRGGPSQGILCVNPSSGRVYVEGFREVSKNGWMFSRGCLRCLRKGL